MNELGMNFIKTPELPTPGIFSQSEAIEIMNRSLDDEKSLVNPITMYNYYFLELTNNGNPNLSS
jgi:hypothetical protein